MCLCVEGCVAVGGGRLWDSELHSTLPFSCWVLPFPVTPPTNLTGAAINKLDLVASGGGAPFTRCPHPRPCEPEYFLHVPPLPGLLDKSVPRVILICDHSERGKARGSMNGFFYMDINFPV